jgi:hypothetical protein
MSDTLFTVLTDESSRQDAQIAAQLQAEYSAGIPWSN